MDILLSTCQFAQNMEFQPKNIEHYIHTITQTLKIINLYLLQSLGPFPNKYLRSIPPVLFERTALSKDGLDCIEVRPSKVHGKGCFAKRDIQKDEVITMYPCDVLCFAKQGFGKVGLNGYFPSRQYFERFGQKIDKSEITNYGFDLNKNYRIHGHPKLIHNSGYLGHMINDAAKPNSNPKSYLLYQKISWMKMNSKFHILDGNIHVAIVATRLIKKGEEIFIHYGLGYWINS